MAIEDESPDDLEPVEPRDPDRAAILARRRRFVAMAVGGLATAVTGCLESEPAPCLDLVVDAGTDGGRDAGRDAGEPMPCLSPPIFDAGRPPPPPDGGPADAGGDDAGEDDAGGDDAGADDAGADDASSEG